MCSEFPVKGQRWYGSVLSAFMGSSVWERKGWQYLFIWGSLESSCGNEAVFHGCHPKHKMQWTEGIERKRQAVDCRNRIHANVR